MTKPARAKLSVRVKAAAQSIPGTTCYGHGGTEILFSDAAALIVHQGVEGQTIGDIADNVDTLLGEGAFEQLRATGTFMKSDETQLDEPSQIFSLSVDPALLAKLDAQRPVLLDAPEENAPATAAPEIAETPAVAMVETPVVETPAVTVNEAAAVEEPVFTEDTVFSGAIDAEVVMDTGGKDAPSDAPEGDQVDLDLSKAEVTFATTRNGDASAKIIYPGLRTTMAFGVVAEALRGRTRVSCILKAGRSTDKIVAVHGDDDALIYELPRAA